MHSVVKQKNDRKKESLNTKYTGVYLAAQLKKTIP